MADHYTTPDLRTQFQSLERRLREVERRTSSLPGGAAPSCWSGSGAWLTTAPGPTTGIAFVVNAPGTYRLSCEATGYQTTGPTGASIEVAVYLDGINVGSMLLHSDTTANAHLTLPRFSADVALTADTHYVAFRQVQGTSNGGDSGSIELTRVA